MRQILGIVLPYSVGLLLLVAGVDAGGQQPDAKKAAQKFDPPKAVKPDAETMKEIAAKTEQLRKAVKDLKAKPQTSDYAIHVEIYLKAAENIVRFEEWYGEASIKWALQTLDQGLERAKKTLAGDTVWNDKPEPGKWTVFAYQSQIDDSIQPFAILLPHKFAKDPRKEWRIDVVLHGRDSSLTEAKFISAHGTTAKSAPNDLDHIVLEVYGRGNNAYRWASERDVFEALYGLYREIYGWDIGFFPTVLRGFSMGGAGTWHLGLHHPFLFAAISPGAGFTTTHGYAGGLPKTLPDYQEKCLHIYDAVDYAENAFNVPVVAYSGANDPQKRAADNIENALKGFKEPLHFTHLVAPGLEHQMPKEWQDKAEAEIKKYLAMKKPRTRQLNDWQAAPEHVRFVTYTTKYGDFGHGRIWALDRQYEKAVIDSKWTDSALTIKTENIAAFVMYGGRDRLPKTITIDGQQVPRTYQNQIFTKSDGKWSSSMQEEEFLKTLRKCGLQGPIDDAFMGPFHIIEPHRVGWHESTAAFANATRERFVREWDRYFRGTLKMYDTSTVHGEPDYNLILFGDPQSNPMIAEVLPKLPIVWTSEKLVVNGVEYDAKTHVPVLIYPNPISPNHYVVINSGHTFHEADFKGTNALLFPRLGDWAVLKPAPTASDPAAYEVVAAGLFDEKWQFPKKTSP